MTVPTDFQPPSNTPRSPGKFLQRRWFRVIFLTCLLGVCLVAGLVVAGLFFIETRPAQAFIQMEVPAKRNFRAQLYDASGRELVNQMNNGYFDISTFSDGTYLIVITDLNTLEKVSKKIVVVK